MSEANIPMAYEQVVDETESRTRLQEIREGVGQFVGRATLALSLALGSGGVIAAGESIVSPEVAEAVVDNYPDKNAYDCGNGIWCKNGNWQSSRGYAYRNCTDWAAWRIPQITGKPVAGMGNGGDWDNNAYKLRAEVDNIPEVGDAAVFDAPLYNGDVYGHVAVVEAVRKEADGSRSALISEYNYGNPGNFRNNRWVKADHYVDFTPDKNEGALSNSAPEKKRSDFNGSGRSDILLYQAGTGPDNIFYGRENKGSFGKYNFNLDREYQIAVGNFNGDEEADFFAYGKGDEPDYVFYGQPDPAEFNKFAVSISGNYDQIVAGDFNGDGKDDVFLYAQNGIDKVMSGTSTGGHFTYNDINIQLSQDYQVTSGKYNDDKRSDIFLYNENGTDYILTGRDTKGEFGKYTTSPQIDRQYERPVSGDYNGDGRDDALLYGKGDEPDRIFYGRTGAGEFGSYPTSIKGNYKPIATGDYNGDKKDDVLMHGPGDAPDRVLYGSGNEGTFDPVAIELNGNYRRVST